MEMVVDLTQQMSEAVVEIGRNADEGANTTQTALELTGEISGKIFRSRKGVNDVAEAVQLLSAEANQVGENIRNIDQNSSSWIFSIRSM